MKIFTEIEELWGKHQYKDSRLQTLYNEFGCEKINFYTVEFLGTNPQICDCLLIKEEKLLDFIVDDLAKTEILCAKKIEQPIFKKIFDILNSSKPLFEALNTDELKIARENNLITAKPIVLYREVDIQEILQEIFLKTRSIFFFTIVKKQATAWLVPEGTDILTCAGKIHTDLAKGFIRAEVFNVSDIGKFYKLEDARVRGFLKVVDKDYIVNDGDVLDIKFNPPKK